MTLKMELMGFVARAVVGCEKGSGVKIDPSTDMNKTVVGEGLAGGLRSSVLGN